MKTKIWRWAIAMFLLFGAMSASTLQAHDEPNTATYFDQQAHTLAAQTATWHKFEFMVDHLGPRFLCRIYGCPEREVYTGHINLKLVGAEQSGLQFEVYAPSQVARWRDEEPVGRGNPADGDLTWAGSSNENGVWYVRVVNPTDAALEYRFDVQGVRVLLARTEAKPAPTPTFYEQFEAARKAKATKPAANSDPNQATWLDRESHTIAPNSSLWYRIPHTDADTTIQLTVVGGATQGLQLEVYGQERIARWWQEGATGQGDAVDGALVWSGVVPANIAYYVRIVNPTSREVTFAVGW